MPKKVKGLGYNIKIIAKLNEDKKCLKLRTNKGNIKSSIIAVMTRHDSMCYLKEHTFL